MSFPAPTNKPDEYACVVRMVNHFAAVHIDGAKKVFISEHPEVDFKVAESTAKAFATLKQIPFKSGPFQQDRPIMTVVKKDEKWFPGEIHPDKLRALTSFGPMPLGGTQEYALAIAQAIATGKGLDFIPQIGITMCSE